MRIEDTDRQLPNVAVRPGPQGIACEHNVLVAGLGEHERSVPDERRRFVPLCSERLDLVPRPREQRKLRKQVEHVRARLGQTELERQRIQCLGLDAFQEVRGVDGLLAHGRVGEGEVFGRERLSVTPAKPFAQPEHVRASVR